MEHAQSPLPGRGQLGVVLADGGGDDDGVGALERTDAAADVTLDIGDLGAVWLGGQTIAARAAAGYVTGDPAAVAALDAALRTPTGPVTTIDF